MPEIEDNVKNKHKTINLKCLFVHHLKSSHLPLASHITFYEIHNEVTGVVVTAPEFVYRGYLAVAI